MKTLKASTHGLFAALAALGLASNQARAQYTYATIDDPVALTNNGSTIVEGISGNIVVGYYTGPLTHGFYHTLGATNYTTLDDPAGYKNGSSATQAYGISGNYIVGCYQDQINDSGSYGFIYNMTTSNYTTIEDPASVSEGVSSAYAYGISGNNILGEMVQTSDGVQYVEGFLTTLPSGGYSQFYYPSPSRVLSTSTNYATYPGGISGGYVAGYWVDENLVYHGFVYNTGAQSYTMISSPAGGGAPLTGIDGNNVVGYYADPNHGYNYSGFIYNFSASNYVNTAIRVPSASGNTYARGISGATVVGYYVDNSGVDHGFAATLAVPTLTLKKTGNDLVFTATNGAPGAAGFILETTDLAVPANQWPELSSNVFNASGAFTVTNAIVPNMPPTFYELSETPQE